MNFDMAVGCGVTAANKPIPAHCFIMLVLHRGLATKCGGHKYRVLVFGNKMILNVIVYTVSSSFPIIVADLLVIKPHIAPPKTPLVL